MKIRIYNAKIATMAPKEFIQTGEVHIADDKITYVGTPIYKPYKIQWDREIDAQGNLVMPGFKDAHTHSPMTFLRSYTDDVPLKQWLYEKVFPMEEKLTGEDIYWNSILAYMEYLTSGITANFDMYKMPAYTAKAATDIGFRTVFCGYLNDFTGSLEEMEKEYCIYNKMHPLLSYQLGFHAEYTTNQEHLQGVAQLAKKYKAPVYMHNAETKEEVKSCILRYGKTPTVVFRDMGIYQYGGGGFHCVHMTQEDMEICKENKVWVITNPGSNLKLASGIAPIREMLQRGIGLAIGTDGPASNNCLDIFREMFLTTGLQKVTCEDATAVSAEEVLQMATTGGAHAMGLPQCDSIAPGKQADLIMIDLHMPNMQPLNHIKKNLVYSGSKQNVKMTMIAGKILYENGKFNIGYAPEEVYHKVKVPSLQ